MTPDQIVKKHYEDHIDALRSTLSVNAFMQLDRVASHIIMHSTYCIGNGGSMSDCMHFAGEMLGKYKDKRFPLHVMSLCDPAVLTCIANDFGYENIFSRQLEAVHEYGSVLLALSTSGTSPNIVKALDTGKKLGYIVVLITKKSAPDYTDICDEVITIDTDRTDICQEVTTMLLHIICQLIEEKL